jgi:radical SAM family uncharacterized protein/radical SAM-linked protein
VKDNQLKETLFNHILPRVLKPGRYVGNEVNMVRKSPEDMDVRVALVFPDVYEVGMSYLGFPILYTVLNQMDRVYAERVYAPWVDLEKEMRQRGVPLFSLETHSAVSDFDVIGFTLQYELHFTTILNLIDLAGLPLNASAREGWPLIIAGGPSGYNPEPMADFFDAIVLGDGETVTREVVEIVADAKKQGQDRWEVLERLAGVKGVYVPGFYRPLMTASGEFGGLVPESPRAPKTIRARIVDELSSDSYPKQPLVPIISTTHDRVSLEIARGCSRGCRFCNAGMLYRPVRERTVSDVVALAKQSIKVTGYDEISLVSLSTSDYSDLMNLLTELRCAFQDDMVNLSFPSLRAENFTPEVAEFAKGVRKSGLTLAPEAGSERLRRVINKTTTDADVLRAVDLAFREGWRLVKLYFMIGHPTETEKDVMGIVDMVRRISDLARLHRGCRVNVSISPFVPKAFTPFQWVRQDTMATTQAKLELLRHHLRQRNVKLSWREPEVAAVEGILARGDRRLGAVIKSVWQHGARFEGWREFFDVSQWKDALAENDLSLDSYLQQRSVDHPLPWDHIDKGISRSFLKKEYQRALDETITEDCRLSRCHGCGLASCPACQKQIQQETQSSGPLPDSNPKPPEAPENNPATAQIRIQYRRGNAVRFYSHLDIMRLFQRALRRANIPLVYSEGYNPHPKISFGPALSTGFMSEAEYLDLTTFQGVEKTLLDTLQPELPMDLELLGRRVLFSRSESLSQQVNFTRYRVEIVEPFDSALFETQCSRILQQKELFVERQKKNNIKKVDIRPFIDDIKPMEHGFELNAHIQDGKTVRVDELLDQLFPGQTVLRQTARVTRMGIWRKYGEYTLSPMDF